VADDGEIMNYAILRLFFSVSFGVEEVLQAPATPSILKETVINCSASTGLP